MPTGTNSRRSSADRRGIANFRLLERLFAQIERIVAINQLPAITTEVVTLARERLVDGPP
jgi:hypothetical protein